VSARKRAPKRSKGKGRPTAAPRPKAQAKARQSVAQRFAALSRKAGEQLARKVALATAAPWTEPAPATRGKRLSKPKPRIEVPPGVVLRPYAPDWVTLEPAKAKPLGPKGALRAMVERFGIDDAAKRLEVSPVTLRRWDRTSIPSGRKRDVKRRWEQRDWEPREHLTPSPARAMRSLVREVGRKDAARRMGVSPSTLGRWLDEGIPRDRKATVKVAWARRDDAKRAAGTEALYGKLPTLQGEASFVRKGAVSEATYRETIDARKRAIRDGDPGWTLFLADAQARGFTKHDARNKWMSPKFKGKR